MLKAYEYTERGYDIKKREIDISIYEKKMALQYVIDHPNHIKRTACPVCGENHCKYIFDRWDVEYLYCKDCGTIYVPVEDEIEQGYRALKSLTEFQNSDVYQSEEERYRGLAWDEIVSWLTYRTYRYLGRNTRLNIIDIGNKYRGLSRRLRESKLCGRYELRDSKLPDRYDALDTGDVVLYLNQIKHERNPREKLMTIREWVSHDGLFVMSSRLGSGFDVLTLKGGTESIFPYEHIMLPSRRGIEILLRECGFELLEITTPGTEDVDAVFNHKERVDHDNFFVKCLIETADDRTKSDFQQFLQKNCLSSFAQVIARKA